MFSKKISYLFILILIVLLFISKQRLLVGLILIAYVVILLSPFFLMMLGNKKYNENDYTSASKFFNLISTISEASDKTKISCAYMLMKMGHLDDSKKILNKINSGKLPVNELITFNLILSITFWKEDNLPEAINLMENLYSKYKTTGIYQNLGFYLLLNGDYSKALELNKEAFDYNNTDHTILDNLGMSYYFLGQYDNAIEIYEKFMDSNPQFPSPYFYYAQSQIKSGKKETALEVLQKGLNCKFSNLAGITREDFENVINTLE